MHWAWDVIKDRLLKYLIDVCVNHLLILFLNHFSQLVGWYSQDCSQLERYRTNMVLIEGVYHLFSIKKSQFIAETGIFRPKLRQIK